MARPKTPQQYGDMYTAAAMELAFGEEGFVPGEAVEGLFAPGDVTLTLSLDDGGEAGSYSVGKGLAARFEVLLCSYEWTALETLPEQPAASKSPPCPQTAQRVSPFGKTAAQA